MGWLLAALTLLSLSTTFACTTLVFGRKATKDGSVLASHTNDADGAGAGNINHVPAQDWPANSTRAPGIPQISHTYAYHEEGYAAMNEHQVGLGESTCACVFNGAGGSAKINIVALSQIGLERGATAQEAIAIMGSLAEENGFEGDGSFEGSGESLMVVDKVEAWLFHILPDDTGSSAVWCALKVPDDHFAVVANAFAIREVNVSLRGGASPTLLFSDSMLRVSRERGWLKAGEHILDQPGARRHARAGEKDDLMTSS